MSAQKAKRARRPQSPRKQPRSAQPKMTAAGLNEHTAGSQPTDVVPVDGVQASVPAAGPEQAQFPLAAFRRPAVPLPGAGLPPRRPRSTAGGARDDIGSSVITAPTAGFRAAPPPALIPPSAPTTPVPGPAPGARCPVPTASGTVLEALGLPPDLGPGVVVEVPRSPALQKAPAAAVQVVTASCDAVPADAPHALGVTYWFQAASHGAPYTVRLRLVGRRRQAAFGDPASSFDVVRAVTGVVPGSGPVAVTLRVMDVAAGQWDVWVVPEEDDRPDAPVQELAAGSASGASGFAPLVRVQGPGVRVAAWPTLVALAAGLGVTVQGALAGAVGLPGGRLLAVALLACLIGLVGAKVYYLLTHPASDRAGGGRTGMSVQGFILGSITTLIVGAGAWSMPVGVVLGATAPALLAGLAVGRLGCFFGGCCAGRPTASRWGVWSSDRRIGVRRVPTQLLEALSAAVLVVPAALIVASRPAAGMQVFLGFLAAYILGRQLLFPWRSIPRATRHGRTLTMAASGAVLVGTAGSLLAGALW